MPSRKASLAAKVLDPTVIVTSLGYFVDMFDMYLFNMFRIKSLTDLGLFGSALTQNGLFIVNCQWAGYVLGAYAAGVAGDRWGRKASLLATIVIYSLGTLACAFVQDVHTYALARFITGFGLAGELGTGITLIAEKLHPSHRGIGVMTFITMGFVGTLAAGLMAEYVPWRTAYIIGAVMGLGLLALRALLSESGMFESIRNKKVVKGGLKPILRNPALLRKYFSGIILLLPSIFIAQIIWSLSPEIGKGMGIVAPVKANIALFCGFCGAIAGDLLACWFSERMRNRKRTLALFLLFGVCTFLKFLLIPAESPDSYYFWSAVLGLTQGAWVVGVTWVAEHFATNIRSTAATTVPNIARALVIPMNIAYANLKGSGTAQTVALIGFTVFTLAFIGWRALSETYGKDLDYLEIS